MGQHAAAEAPWNKHSLKIRAACTHTQVMATVISVGGRERTEMLYLYPVSIIISYD